MADMKLNELEHEQRQEYQNLMIENKDLLNEINMQRQELENLNMGLGQAENRLRVGSAGLCILINRDGRAEDESAAAERLDQGHGREESRPGVAAE